jgi:hypothetical protein
MFGLETTFHCMPTHCSISVCAGPRLLLDRSPTAHTSVADRAATPKSLVSPAPVPGLLAMFHWPQLTARAALAPVVRSNKRASCLPQNQQGVQIVAALLLASKEAAHEKRGEISLNGAMPSAKAVDTSNEDLHGMQMHLTPTGSIPAKADRNKRRSRRCLLLLLRVFDKHAPLSSRSVTRVVLKWPASITGDEYLTRPARNLTTS